MSNLLGFSDCGLLRVSKSADIEETLIAPPSYDFAGYSGELVVRESEDADTALLTINTTATANGSVMIFSGRNIILLGKADDWATLPENATDSDDPWEGVYEWVTTDPDSLTTRLVKGAILVERGVVR